jgi:hypothetical protein
MNSNVGGIDRILRVAVGLALIGVNSCGSGAGKGCGGFCKK